VVWESIYLLLKYPRVMRCVDRWLAVVIRCGVVSDAKYMRRVLKPFRCDGVVYRLSEELFEDRGERREKKKKKKKKQK
jgi:hypothetical protein